MCTPLVRLKTLPQLSINAQCITIMNIDIHIVTTETGGGVTNSERLFAAALIMQQTEASPN